MLDKNTVELKDLKPLLYFYRKLRRARLKIIFLKQALVCTNGLIRNMLSRISNTASLKDIEIQLNSKFDYDYLYEPTSIINGFKESSVCVITAQAPDRIQYGIWGILPRGFIDSWKSFQSFHNTLEIEYELIPETSWLFEALTYRRCLIVATGFFTAEFENHKVKTFHNQLKSHDVFCFAGIYNILEDGFMSCSILTHSNGSSHYHLKDPKPIIVAADKYSDFLNQDMPIDDICNTTFEMDKSIYNQRQMMHREY
ncbi:putative SOS response-associated peptidase YedK [Gelidibacter algens]|uniref:Putative SOS response-associated peptidase YedK n=2 Tax=Gelidibacter algens TaxID=49280 RepID=A0A327SB73_9FLAO|nr:putative SOS response-associated peptidase YedK [Gelidibacter algens]